MAETRKIPVAGFMSPPGWLDPSPEEFRTILDGPAIIQQTMMPIYNFVFGKIANIAGTLPEMLYCARQLGSAESDVIAHTGTPFGWAGLGTEREARDRRDLMVDAAGGVPVVMAGLAILDGLRALGAGLMLWSGVHAAGCGSPTPTLTPVETVPAPPRDGW